MVLGCGLYSFGTGYGAVEDFCGHGNKFLHSIPLEKFLTSSVNIKFLGELFVPCIWLSLKENNC